MKLDETLQQLKAGRKAKRLQSLWPKIEERLAEGVSHAEILGLLNESGFDLTERTYKSYLYRYRKRRRVGRHQPDPMRLTEISMRQSDGEAQQATSPVSAEITKHKRPPTFEFNPCGDPSILK